MNRTAHLAAGAATGVVTSYAMIRTGMVHNDIGLVAYNVALWFASTFPDIDNENSRIGRKFHPLIWFMQSGKDHRKFITHTPLFAVITFILLLMCATSLTTYIAFGWLIGYLMHLFLDTCTWQGIRWLYPISKKYYSIKRARAKNKTNRKEIYERSFKRA